MDLALVDVVKREWKDALFASLGRFPETATPNDLYLALALAARREVLRRWVRTSETYYRESSRTVAYLSAEFLLGPHLASNLLMIGVEAETRQAMAELGHDLDRRRSRASATEASAGSPPATWTRSRRSRSPRSATGSATSSGSSTS